MRDAVSGLLHATSELLLLHVDLGTRKVIRFGDAALAALAAWTARDAGLPPLADIGRRIVLSRAEPGPAA